MHAAFAVDHTPLLSYPVAVWVLLRGVPFVSVRIMAAFLAKMGASVSDGDVIGAFHYGVAGWNSCASKAIDQYVKAVLAILAAL